MNQQQDVTTDVEVQPELLPALVEGYAPDAYVVIPVSVLSLQIAHNWDAVARHNRGEVRLGWFQIRLMRALLQLGYVVDTKHAHPGEDPR